MLESITIFLRDFGYFSAGCLFGGMIMFALAVLAFSGPMYWQEQDIKRLKKQRNDAEDRNESLEKLNEIINKMKVQAQLECWQEGERAQLLEKVNEDLQQKYDELKAINLKLYVELDAHKARSFQEPKTNKC